MAASAKGTLKLTNFYKPARCVLITVNYKHFDNKHTHYIYSNEYFDTKIISLLKPQTAHFKSSYQQLKRLFYQYQCFVLITFEKLTCSCKALWIISSPTIFSVLWSCLQSFRKFSGKQQQWISEAYLGPYQMSMMGIFNTRIHFFLRETSL